MMKSALAVSIAIAASGCYADDPLPPPPKKTLLKGDLAVDIREAAHVELTITGTEIEASIALTKGFGVTPGSDGERPGPAGAIAGKGRVEAFGEAGTTLYTARFDVPANYEGPCGGEDVSLALALHRRGSDARVGGSLAAYCGKSVWHGVPVRMLRLTGEMPLP